VVEPVDDLLRWREVAQNVNVDPAVSAALALEVAGARFGGYVAVAVVGFVRALWHVILLVERLLASGETIGSAGRRASAAP
jgi:hypothetical protein